MENNIREHRRSIQNNIVKQLGQQTPTLQKSITPQQFDEKYDVGYEVFEKGNINSYVMQSLKNNVATEEIIKSLSSLTQVLVKGDSEDQMLWVRKVQSETTEE